MARPESPSTPRPFEEIPRQPLGRLLGALFTGGGGRIDMRGSLERQHTHSLIPGTQGFRQSPRVQQPVTGVELRD